MRIKTTLALRMQFKLDGEVVNNKDSLKKPKEKAVVHPFGRAHASMSVA